MRVWACALVAGIALGAAPELHAAAEGEAHHGPNWGLLILHVINFSFLLFLLNRYAKKPLLDFIAQRSFGIRHEIETAEQRLSDAEAEIATLRARLAGLEDERQGMLDAAATQAEQQRDRAIVRAQETAARIREDAKRVASQEIERGRQELRAEAADLATSLAGDLLRDQLTPDDDKRLVAEFVARLDGPRAGGTQ